MTAATDIAHHSILLGLHSVCGDIKETDEAHGSFYLSCLACITYIHTYMKFITRCIVEDGSNQRRGLLLGGGVQEEMEEK